MSETVSDVRGLPKPEAYAEIERQARGVLEGITDEVAVMATLSCLLHHGFGHLWTGFYRAVAPQKLQVGPYQGSLGCLEIAFGRGVCGTSAQSKRTVVVPDVHAFEGHIACDARSRSEIVVPVLSVQSDVRAVLDIDSDRLGAFDEVDARALEALVRTFLR
ncbi:MAG: GAF domain-containing protein [Archangiaceae bacterium]|nr:GAF domain-containing protein [Archangiaceae bacterium]